MAENNYVKIWLADYPVWDFVQIREMVRQLKKKNPLTDDDRLRLDDLKRHKDFLTGVCSQPEAVEKINSMIVGILKKCSGKKRV